MLEEEMLFIFRHSDFDAFCWETTRGPTHHYPMRGGVERDCRSQRSDCRSKVSSRMVRGRSEERLLDRRFNTHPLFTGHRRARKTDQQSRIMTSDSLSQMLSDFLAGARAAL